MSWSSPESWPTRLFSGDPLIIVIAFLITLSLPVLVHLYFYTTSARGTSSGPPLFLLLGPSGAGKTSLLALLQSSEPLSSSPDATPPTRVSQISSPPVTLQLPASIALGSNKYRSENDDSSRSLTPYALMDTPGHPKLRASQALRLLSSPSLRGIIFVVDAASLEGPTIRDTAGYLHDVLLQLQRRRTSKSKPNKQQAKIPLLVAANKQDLFTALPAGAVRARLESEIELVRSSRSKGLVTVGEKEEEEPEEALGGDGEDKFSFKMLAEDYELEVDVIGGAVGGDEAGKGVRRWEEWVGGCL